MVARNEWQDRALVEYRVRRKFYAVNSRFKSESTMVVETVFRTPEGTQTTVVSHEGSKFIRSRVFDKILEAETETKANKDKHQVDLTPANYIFTLIGSVDCDGRACYHMKIVPKKPDKYSVTGELWIDGEDYSIVRIKGSPAKKVSFWTGHTEFDRRYKKIDGIWLPDRMDSTSEVRFAGHSLLTIEYSYDAVLTNLTADRR
jgi:hypothetical protein